MDRHRYTTLEEADEILNILEQYMDTATVTAVLRELWATKACKRLAAVRTLVIQLSTKDNENNGRLTNEPIPTENPPTNG